jgi:putative transcriptional regulator
MNHTDNSLKAQLLLAMPQIGDPRFHKAVIFLTAHDDKGAMGLVLNHPIATLTFGDVLRQVGVVAEKPLPRTISDMAVRAGGPVEGIHGFLLHSADFRQKDTIIVDDMFAVSGTVDSLRSIAGGYRPEKMLFTLGYSDWGPGQLEREMQENAWISVPANYELVFGTRDEEMWEKAFATIGINPAHLTGFSGRA